MPRSRTWTAVGVCVASLAALAGSALVVLSPAKAEEPGRETAQVVAVSDSQPEPVAERLLPHEKGVAESAQPFANSTPQQLIEGTLAAWDREDAAWLARTLASTAGKAMITEVDLHAANRQFLTRSIQPMWQAINTAWQGHEYRVTEQGETAEVVFRTGSSLGELTIVLVRINECWFYAGT